MTVNVFRIVVVQIKKEKEKQMCNLHMVLYIVTVEMLLYLVQ